MKNTGKISDGSHLRRKAEELLLKKKSEKDLQRSEVDNLKLIHELEVHQIELELQNEELQVARAAVQQAAINYTELFDFAPVGYFTLTETGQIKEVNFFGAKMLGKERILLNDALLGFFVSDSSKPIFNQFLKKSFSSGTRESCEITLSNHGLLPMHVRLSGIVTASLGLCHLVVVDITESTRAQRLLQEAKWRVDNIIEGTHSGTWEWNVQTGETVFNEIWADLIGYTLGELAPISISTWRMLAHPDDLKLSDDLLEKYFSGTVPFYDTECRMKHKKGHWVWVHDRGRIITRTSDGKPLLMFGTHTDITTRKQSEEIIKNALGHYKALVYAIPDMIFQISKQGFLIDCTAVTEDLFYQEQSVIGKNIHDITPRDFADLLDEKINLTLSTNQLQIFEHRLLIPVKGMRDYEARMVPSSVDEVIAIVRDITEKKTAETEIIFKNEQLIQANAEKDKFFSIMAHDLRGPFNVFLGFTRMLAEQLPTLTAEEIQKIAVSMRNSATNLFGLLENLLEWSRLQRGLISFKPDTCLLEPIIIENLKPFTEPAFAKQIEIRMEIPEDFIVYADKYMLGSAIRNLVSNALKFTPRGGSVICAARSVDDNAVEISISDTGIGMSEKMMDNLFSFDENTNRKGTEGELSTGLGLFLCKEFIEKHGEKILVESQEGKGSIFSFSLAVKGLTTDK